MFILSVIFIPNLGWPNNKKQKISKEILEKINLINMTSKSKQEVLEKILDFQMSRFYSRMRQSIRRANLLFISSFDKLWNKKGLLHCHQQCFILRELLIKSKRFSKEDIKYRLSPCYHTIHQYMLINMSDNPFKQRWIIVDPFAISLGFKIGEKLPFFTFQVMKKRGIDSTNKKESEKYGEN